MEGIKVVHILKLLKLGYFTINDIDKFEWDGNMPMLNHNEDIFPC